MSNDRSHEQLPSAVLALFNGRELEEKAGQTMLLSAAEPDGWVRVALLSVGEILAHSPTTMSLILFSGSRTTAAVTISGRAMLIVIIDGTIYKVYLRMAPSTYKDSARLAPFRGEVISVDADRVPYARVLHGVEFELVDPAGAVERWAQQLQFLKGLEP